MAVRPPLSTDTFDYGLWPDGIPSIFGPDGVSDPGNGGWYGGQFIPDYSGPSLYGSSAAGKPFYYYGGNPGGYAYDQLIAQNPSDYDPAALNAWAKNIDPNNPDFGRLSYIASLFGGAGTTPYVFGMPPSISGSRPDTRPSFWNPQTKSFQRYDFGTVPGGLDPQTKANVNAANYGYSDPLGSGLPDYGSILQTLKSTGWDPSMGYGAQDWNAIRSKAFGPDSVNPNFDYNYLNNLLSAVAPSGNSSLQVTAPEVGTGGAPNFQFSPDMASLYNQDALKRAGQAGDALNRLGSFQNGYTSPADFVTDPGNYGQAQSLMNDFYAALGTPEAQANRRAYFNLTGGNNYGGIVRPLGDVYGGFDTGSARYPGNPWSTLNSMGAGAMPQNMSTTSSNAWGGLQGSPWG